MSIPVVQTAIPKRRYQLGEFVVSVLGEVQSGDRRAYRFIMAVAREPDPRPNLFVSAEPNPGEGGRWALRVSMADGEQVVATGDAFGNLDDFSEASLKLVSRILSLEDEVPYRLM